MEGGSRLRNTEWLRVDLSSSAEPVLGWNSSPSPGVELAVLWAVILADLLGMIRQRLKDLATLNRRKGRRALGQFLVEGVRSVEAAMAAGAPLVEVLVTHEALDTQRVHELVEAVHVPVHPVAARDLDRISEVQTSQGIVAVSDSIVRHQLEGEGAVVILDGVQDPGNVGALVRSAAWFGAGALVADTRSADFEGPKAVRASMGGLWDLQLVRIPDLEPVLADLRAAGRQIWGADMHGTPISDWHPGGNDALVLGNEGNGLTESVAAHLTGRVSIPGALSVRGVESLNVGVAAGVILHRWLG